MAIRLKKEVSQLMMLLQLGCAVLAICAGLVAFLLIVYFRTFAPYPAGFLSAKALSNEKCPLLLAKSKSPLVVSIGRFPREVAEYAVSHRGSFRPEPTGNVVAIVEQIDLKIDESVNRTYLPSTWNKSELAPINFQGPRIEPNGLLSHFERAAIDGQDSGKIQIVLEAFIDVQRLQTHRLKVGILAKGFRESTSQYHEQEWVVFSCSNADQNDIEQRLLYEGAGGPNQVLGIVVMLFVAFAFAGCWWGLGRLATYLNRILQNY